MSTPQPPDTPRPADAPEPPDAPAAPAPSGAQPEKGGQPAKPAEQPAAPPRQPSTWQPMLYLRIGLLLAVVGYTIAFVVQNTNQIKIDFVFTSARVHLIWEILLLLAVGLVGGVLLSQLYRHRRATQLAKKAGKTGDAGSNVRR